MNIEQFAERIAEDERRAGFQAALRRYAWWKDGIQYVGCGVTTLEEALAETNNTDMFRSNLPGGRWELE